MNLSSLFTQLLAASEFTSTNSLAQHTNQTQPFVARMLSGDTDTWRNANKVFEALTPGITAEELMAAIELIKAVRRQQIEREQIL